MPTFYAGQADYIDKLNIIDTNLTAAIVTLAIDNSPSLFNFTATNLQTAFLLAPNYQIKAIYKNGLLLRETIQWSRSNNSTNEIGTLVTGAATSDWVCLMAVRTS